MLAQRRRHRGNEGKRLTASQGRLKTKLQSYSAKRSHGLKAPVARASGPQLLFLFKKVFLGLP